MAQASADGRPSFGDWDSSAYALHRPSYPASLFDVLAAECPRREFAWDCAAGSGQATGPLAERFEHVVATDINAAQLGAAPTNHARVVCDAVAAPLRDGTIDLVVVAQALHWFAGEAFFSEVARVARGGMFAAWSYGLFGVDEHVDAVVQHFYDEVVGRYWLPERAHIHDDYASIDFPFAERDVRRHSMSLEWSAREALGYLDTWSAVRRYRDVEGSDPIPLVAGLLEEVWGPGSRRVTWPLTVHVCRVS